MSGIRKILIITAALVLSVAAWSKPVVKVSLDSTRFKMGQIIDMHVSIDEAEQEHGRFPIFDGIMESGYVSLSGDSIEMRAPGKIDTVVKDGRRLVSMTVPVQSFDSGFYRLPELAYVSGVDTTLSNSVKFSIYPPAGLTAETPIDDYANVSEPENASIFDALPDWMVNYWWLLLLILLLIAAGTYLYMMYRKQGYIIPPKPQPTPYEVAISALRELKEQKLWEQGMEKEYYTHLTDILRTYMEGRFGINAMEMTSKQIMHALHNNRETYSKRGYVRQIVDMADFVKFAKVRPLPIDNVASFDNAMKFVEETKPLPVMETEEDQKKSKKKPKVTRKEVKR